MRGPRGTERDFCEFVNVPPASSLFPLCRIVLGRRWEVPRESASCREEPSQFDRDSEDRCADFAGRLRGQNSQRDRLGVHGRSGLGARELVADPARPFEDPHDRLGAPLLKRYHSCARISRKDKR
ncbi:unnamed protein product [Caenorhabditis auriculariae]|uniref:Uncharacterized protein n=1 Tax=Caenorhabditis auriculariae TaxID=2777116 RepID=A0A8S1GVN9_9PELO|nr:unnamed protein product [Caenorhabditis auriculariae]